ncbi:hypothetical protein A5784_06315 [Mycobacterium sp. 852013-50091_SCH5140682]|nr:hypothetical protein A5784_06315 [Mycobacterium sp. 852013-50091_SCH5140682]
MRITGGHTITVYRRTQDRHGDAETEILVGTIEHCAIQPTRVTANNGFGETVEMVTIVWAPRAAAIKLENADRITLGGNVYRVIGERIHDENHPATGHDYGHYAVQVEAVV